ncbi:hypothetical protein BpHYR1_044746 [Brachionus plicatilis]|uniref:Uncharacterized protein n=1 Tax=Brachionus plicatilis TaxID=10195 RepID=A0A3M7SLQ8_BRAPC|nr:hypothetical protein BpHYR1_044746 [Brachionus plicatilis]
MFPKQQIYKNFFHLIYCLDFDYIQYSYRISSFGYAVLLAKLLLVVHHNQTNNSSQRLEILPSINIFRKDSF